MFDLSQISDSDIATCGKAVAEAGAGQASMEAAATKIVKYLFDQIGSNGAAGCVLARLYATQAYGGLDAGLRGFADGILGDGSATDDMKCLTLLATAGQDRKWNDRGNSAGHKAIPLPSANFVGQIPMISRLLNQLGLDVNRVIRPDPGFIVDQQDKTHNVFHVEEAVGSPYIPAQDDFVVPYGVRSVLGLGGLLSTGDLFVTILFTKAVVTREVAQRFKPLALSVKTAIEPFAKGPVFAAA